MKKFIYLVALTALCFISSAVTNPSDCDKDVNDPRGKMKPWNKGAWETGLYRNLFLEAGYKQKDIDAKLAKAYYDVFEGPDRVYFEVGDSMAYVSDLKNHDVRTEGMSYGMMIAVQLNKKDVFDRLWRWAKKYMQHQGGPRDAYFAWSVKPKTGEHNSEGSASDGELYFITDLLFASNRWGNSTGINYYGEARRILDAMWSKDGTGGQMNVINVKEKKITFVPDTSGYHFTDPSYNLPAFFEIWAEYAKDGHEQFYMDCADTARAFLHRACSSSTGLNADITGFDGSPRTFRRFKASFRFDSWRVPMNIAMDYSWLAKDKKWQQNYCKRIQNFLFCRGINTFEDQYNVDGTLPDWILPAGGYRTLRHSLGLVATSAAASLMGTQAKSWKFVDAVWNAKLEPYNDGYFDPYYDGLLYLFSLMHLSGNYRIITPAKTPSTKIELDFNIPKDWKEIDSTTYVLINFDSTLSYYKQFLSAGHQPWRFDPANTAAACLIEFGIKYQETVFDFASHLNVIEESKLYSFAVNEKNYMVFIKTKDKTPVAYKLKVKRLY